MRELFFIFGIFFNIYHLHFHFGEALKLNGNVRGQVVHFCDSRHDGGGAGAAGRAVQHGGVGVRPLPVQHPVTHNHSVGAVVAVLRGGGEDEDIRAGVVQRGVAHLHNSPNHTYGFHVNWPMRCECVNSVLKGVTFIVFISFA